MSNPMDERYKDEELHGIDWDWDYLDAPDCAECGGPCGVLGQLGTRTHWLCRDCGMHCSTTPTLDTQEVQL